MLSRFKRAAQRFLGSAAFATAVFANEGSNALEPLPRVEALTLIKSVTPDYPQYARMSRAQGTVTMSAVVNVEGKITNVKAVSGPAILIPSAVAAARQWMYRPALVDGVPMNAATMIRVNFYME